jgi:hypothetical protein
MLATASALFAGLMGCVSPAFASYAVAPHDGLSPGIPVPAWAAGKSIHFYPVTPAGAWRSDEAVGAAASPVASPLDSPLAVPDLEGQPYALDAGQADPAVKASASALTYEGGPVQHQPHVVAIFWGTDWETGHGSELKHKLEVMYEGLAGSGWQQILTQYHGATGPISASPVIEIYDDQRVAAPTNVGFSAIVEEAEAVMVADGTGSDPDITYVVLPAPGTEYAQNFDTGFCGWHSSMGGERALAFIPYEGQPPFEKGCAIGGADVQTSKAASHEYAESVTDPEIGKGWTGGKEGDRDSEEVADLCEFNGPRQMADGAWVAELWDDARNGCEAEDDDPGLVEIGPYISSAHAYEITHASATLEASLAPCGREAHYYFEYGRTSAYGTRTPVGVTPAGTWEYVPYRASIEGLQPGTYYSWRLVVETSNGVATTGERTLFTKPYVALYSEDAEDVGTTEAKLYGVVNPEGEEATYHFEYGTTDAYGSSTAEASAGSGAGEVEVNTPISDLEPNTVYHFRIVAKDSHGTFYGSDEEFVTGGKPAAETAPTTELGATSATLHGTVGLADGPIRHYFEYGTTEAYGSSTPEQQEGTIASPLQVSEDLTDLAPGTLYHYRIVTTNSYGTAYGSDQVFTTDAEPSAETEQATHIGTSSATLTGTIDPNGADAKYYFEYHAGTESSSSTAAEVAGSGTYALEASANVTDLAPGTTYHYRLVASNAFSVVDGEEKTFTTASIVRPEPEVETPPPGGLPTPLQLTPIPLAPTGQTGTPSPVPVAIAFSDLSLPKAQHGDALSVALTIATAGSSVEIVAVCSAHSGGHRRTPVVLGRVRHAAVATGRLKLKVALDAKGMRELRRHRRLTVMVTILVRLPAGTQQTVVHRVTLEL